MLTPRPHYGGATGAGAPPPHWPADPMVQHLLEIVNNVLCETEMLQQKQGVALTERNLTGPPCPVSTSMGDRVRVRFTEAALYFGM